MTETQESIANWAKETFGHTSPLTVAARMSKEFAELLVALESLSRETDPAKIEALLEEARGEAVDVSLMLRQVAHFLGVDLDAGVDAKMVICRARKWERTAGGDYQHV